MMKISIITVCKNSLPGLMQTYESVVKQTHPEREFIIVDALSDDGTNEFVNARKNEIDTYIYEKDDGIYDAMNKGIAAASGDYIVFLNAGDLFFHENVISLFVRNCKSEMFIYGQAIVLNRKTGKTSIKTHSNIDKVYFSHYTICHQSVFFKREVFSRYGGFNLNYKICSDYDWICRFFVKSNETTRYLAFPLCVYDAGGVSKQNSGIRKSEKLEIRKKYYTIFFLKTVDFLRKNLPRLYVSKKIRSILSFFT